MSQSTLKALYLLRFTDEQIMDLQEWAKEHDENSVEQSIRQMVMDAVAA
jgi:hypothetical protein